MTEIETLRAQIEPLIAELEAIGTPEARAALAYRSPIAEELLRQPNDRLQVEYMRMEIARLQGTLLHLGKSFKPFKPFKEPEPSKPSKPSKPFDDGMRRRLRGEWLDPPHLPGTFWLR